MYIRQLRAYAETLNLSVKTNGDSDLRGNKLYAFYDAGSRVSPFYSCPEWAHKNIQTLINSFKATQGE